MACGRDFTAIPDDLALLEFFESKPLDSQPQDGYWCYQFKDEYGVGIRMSWNIFEKSVQTILLLNNVVVEQVVPEGAEELRIVENTLCGSFDLGHDGLLEVQVRPRISIQWSALRKS